MYPQTNLTEEEKKISSNIMLLGETGTGKSTFLNCLINYIQEIDIDENNRYLLFDQKSLKEIYEEKYGEKLGKYDSLDKPLIFNVGSSPKYKSPLRLMDTEGFPDCHRSKSHVQIFEDIKNLFLSSEIESINAVCIFLKATDPRPYLRLRVILNILFNLFGEEIKNNIIFIFTFAVSFNDIIALEQLKKEKDFLNIFPGDINNFHYFVFDNYAYFGEDRKICEKIYEKNTKGFESFFNCVSSLKRISLLSDKKEE